MKDPPPDPLAKVRNPDGTVDWLAVGEAEQARRTNCSTQEMIDVLDWLHANGGTFHVSQAAVRYDDHLTAFIPEHGGRIETERHTYDRDGRRTVTRTVQRFPAPTRRPCSRVVSRSRERRAAPARRTSSSSRTAGTDPPGSSEGDEPAPARLRLARPPAIWTFGFGEQVTR